MNSPWSPILLFVIVLAVPGCSDSPSFTPPAIGESTLHVMVDGRDEFDRPQKLTAPVTISVIASDRTLHTVLPLGDTSCSFAGLPYEYYIVRAEMIGGDPYETLQGVSGASGEWRVHVFVRTKLSPQSHVDSISCSYTPSQYLNCRLVLGNNLPTGCSRRVVVFLGNTPSTSATPGDYFSSFEVWWYSSGNVILVTPILPLTGQPPGRTIYVSARVASLSNRSYYDPLYHVSRYTCLENISTAMSSFVVP